MTVGEPFGMRSYGLAIPTDHPLEEPLHMGILELMETGELEALEEKWWTGEGKCWDRNIRPILTGEIPIKQVH